MQYTFRYNGRDYTVKLEKREDRFVVSEGERTLEVDAVHPAPGCLSLRMGERSVLAYHARTAEGAIVCIHGVSRLLQDPEAAEEIAGPGTEGGEEDGIVTTPMPGKIVAVHVKEGDRVEKGQPLVVVEAMKMQNDLCAGVSGVVKKVHRAPGDQAQFGDPLVEIEPQ